MADHSSSTEADKKRPSILDSFNATLKEKENQGMKAVQEAAGEVKEGVADVMGGMEKPSEKISERAGERGEKGDLKHSGGKKVKKDDPAVVIPPKGKVIFPPQQVMINKVVTVIRREIKVEMKRAAQLEKNLSTGQAKDYNESIARIRNLKSVLQSVLDATLDFLKDLYQRYYGPSEKTQNERVSK